jgi:hypothetical protein
MHMATGATIMPNIASGEPFQWFLTNILAAPGGDARSMDNVSMTGAGDLPSAFAVSDLAAAVIGAAGLAIAELVSHRRGDTPTVVVDRRLASFWFRFSVRPDGWKIPPPWDPIAGDYQAADGWIRLHTNAPHHREAALTVLDMPAEKDAVTAAVSKWRADELEQAIVQRGGCAAAMRDLAAWAAHPNGKAVNAEPLIWRDDADASEARRAPASDWAPSPTRPLAGIRVLDLTRVLAGPVGSRFLAGFGADVLRIDPPDWEEPGVIPEVTLGKRCARLDLRRPEHRKTLEGLLAEADVLMHGYRPDALARLGLDAATRQRIRPGLVDVCLDAYGWSGPWRGRRGFDSLVQMSSGIAAEGMRHYDTDHPKPLPVQALDHATGYLMAAAAVRGLTRRKRDGIGGQARTSLARTAALLAAAPRPAEGPTFGPVSDADFDPEIEHTSWGPARRMRAPLEIAGTVMRWERPASALGSADAVWLAR